MLRANSIQGALNITRLTGSALALMVGPYAKNSEGVVQKLLVKTWFLQKGVLFKMG